MGEGVEERLVWQHTENALYWAHLECVCMGHETWKQRTLGLTEQGEAGAWTVLVGRGWREPLETGAIGLNTLCSDVREALDMSPCGHGKASLGGLAKRIQISC